MFRSDQLMNHLQTSDLIKTESFVFSEWNLNDFENIKYLGNYRYRPSWSESPYYLLPSNFDENDFGNYYTDATDADTVIESGLNDQDNPALFISPKTKMKMLFSLEDCVKPFRPRSGINKVLYLGNIGTTPDKAQYIDDAKSQIARRPRYYMASKDDFFKYWTSYRTEYGVPTPLPNIAYSNEQREVARGISFYHSTTQRNYIEDACPFVVYKKEIPTNKIVVKIQTNVGEESLGNFRYGNYSSVPDPLYGNERKTTPVIWKIQALKNNSWQTLVEFNESSTRADGSPIISADGYVEISYGLLIPEQYSQNFTFAGEISDSSLLPDYPLEGTTFLIKQNQEDVGLMHVFSNGQWQSYTPSYSWSVSSEGVDNNTQFVSKLSNPDYFIDNDSVIYREFEFINGIRIVVETMNRSNCTFDLIEFSPRIFANITDYVSSFSIRKILSDLGNSSIPVGGLSASSGSLDIFDTDFAFNHNNTFDHNSKSGSIIAEYLSSTSKFIFYNQIEDSGIYYLIPQKTLYSMGFPQTVSPASMISLDLRDFFFYLESSKAPQLFMTDVSLSYAVTLLLDAVGFDNYVFKRINTEEEIVIPYFFVEPGLNVAEVLAKLAVSSQTAMFFDEYNNFIVMSKKYILPESEDERITDISLIGQEEVLDSFENIYRVLGYIYSEEELVDKKEDGAYINVSNNFVYVWSDQINQWQSTSQVEKIIKPNIVSFASQDKKVYNSGQINYTTRYLQRSIGSATAALKIDEYKNYVYKPVLLWEVSGNENRQTINEIGGQSGGYVLGAVPLNSDLNDQPPYSLNNIIHNNIIDVGENVYWMTNYQGYFYANGEIIKYDAVEYNVAGLSAPVWITNNQQYQEYFGQLKFNGKMYPTGRVRIYTDPEYQYVNGELRIKDANPIIVNGRGQFGTPIVYHLAGLESDNYWKNNNNVRGCIQEASAYLFNTSKYITYPSSLSENEAGIEKTIGSQYINANDLAKKSNRSSIIKNILTDKNFTELEFNYMKTTLPGSVQSSALNFSGPEIPVSLSPSNFVSYIYKDFSSQDESLFKHFGTRMRIVGKIESGTNKSQTPVGRFPVFTGGVGVNTAPTVSTNQNDQDIIIHGGSGGIAIGINKNTNTGYYFEIAALTVDNIEQYSNNNNYSVSSANILASPAPTAYVESEKNYVKVYTENEVPFEIGESVIIRGLVDSENPTNTSTALNGEYLIVSVAENKKSFIYEISEPLETTSQTGGVASVDIGSAANIANVLFYKIVSDEEGNAIPYKLWSGLTKINVDSGEFYGQSRLMAEDETTVYDLASEYINIGSTRRFFLYINGKQIAVVDDNNPIAERNSLALFVRGSTKCMFDNVYALANNYSQNSIFGVQDGISQVYGDDEIDATEALRKYSISGLVQKTFLSGISSLEDPKYKIFFEEFGTIFREAAYFNILYDRAYPALYAKLMKTLNNIRGYSVSGFYAWSYGAEFLIFNCTDFAITIDDTSGNYLRIMGSAFTQSTTYTLTVDDLYKKRSNLLDTSLNKQNILYDSLTIEKEFNAIKNSREKYGVNEITIESPYIQSQAAAENIFSWIVDKVSKPKKMIGLNVFAVDNIQLGDIVKVRYLNNDGMDAIVEKNKRFVVYQIEYNRQNSGPNMTLFLAEV